MKKLSISEGFAQMLNDYPLIAQNAAVDGLKAVLHPFGNNIILEGCEVTISGTTHNVAAGVVYFDGEPMRVEAHSVGSMTTGSFLIAERYQITLTNNPKTYKDGNVYPMIVETMVRFKKKTTESTYVSYADFVSYSRSIATLLKPSFVELIANYTNGFTLASGLNWNYEDGSPIATGDRLAFKKTIDGRLLLSGYITPNAPNSTTVNGVANCSLILTLDASFRPAKPVYFTTYSGGVSGTYSFNPVLDYAFVLFADGKFCQLVSSLVPYAYTAYFQNIQLIL
jgi:hypothetical protein